MSKVPYCQKCGREFRIPPRDGIDHYGPQNKPWSAERCGGRVVGAGEVQWSEPGDPTNWNRTQGR